ncbi:type II toxin-antitoxin system VapC family toxin [Roseiflexus castenholzii]|uniref:type II toxin-antitoxin system VapC family toxin n=1 Tax=Roseiflexus castenholzii TaxID=120962 RepID=UPI003C7E54A9
MKLLLDTHAFLWFVGGDERLSPSARALIEDMSNDAYLSIASLWEMAIKISLGRLQLAQPFETFIPHQLSLNRIRLLGITISHTAKVSTLPFHHRDPFDRLLVAQAQVEQMPLVSSDAAFDAYGLTRLW